MRVRAQQEREPFAAAEPATIAAALMAGIPVPDAIFDGMYPERVRRLSRVHWTPVEVAIRAAPLLAPRQGYRILDIGSGVGKLCLIGAMASAGFFTGVEQREWLVHVAERLRRRLGIARSRFVKGDAMALDWSDFDAFYLFNPFGENVCRSQPIDERVPGGRLGYYRCVEATMARLEAARVGTRVVTYHGFGGRLPRGYVRHHREFVFSGFLELWIKALDDDD